MAISPHDQSDWVASLLTQYETPLWRYAARLLGDADAARDVVQETFLRLCRQSSAELDGHAVAWLYRVCRTRALDVLRKERPMQTLTDQELLERPSRERSPAAALEQRETTDQLLQLLDTLSAEQQEVVRLKFQHGLSYRQIGEVTGRTSNHVGVMLHTALKTLRERAQRDTTGSASTQGPQS